MQQKLLQKEQSEKISSQNTAENDIEIPKERFISQ